MMFGTQNFMRLLSLLITILCASHTYGQNDSLPMRIKLRKDEIVLNVQKDEWQQMLTHYRFHLISEEKLFNGIDSVGLKHGLYVGLLDSLFILTDKKEKAKWIVLTPYIHGRIAGPHFVDATKRFVVQSDLKPTSGLSLLNGELVYFLRGKRICRQKLSNGVITDTLTAYLTNNAVWYQFACFPNSTDTLYHEINTPDQRGGFLLNEYCHFENEELVWTVVERNPKDFTTFIIPEQTDNFYPKLYAEFVINDSINCDFPLGEFIMTDIDLQSIFFRNKEGEILRPTNNTEDIAGVVIKFKGKHIVRVEGVGKKLAQSIIHARRLKIEKPRKNSTWVRPKEKQKRSDRRL